MWVLPVPLLPMAMTFLPALDVFTAGQLHDQGLVHRGDGQEVEGVQALRGGKRAALIRRWTMRWWRSMSSSFGEAQQVVGVVGAFGRALGGQLTVLPQGRSAASVH